MSSHASEADPRADGPACCDACAAGRAPVTAPNLIALERDRRPSISRAVDARITILGLVVSAAFVGTAVAAMALPDATRRGLWLPVHLSLAGGAGTAVAAVLPFFVAALTVAPSRGRAIRGGSIALIASGALTASRGVAAAVAFAARPSDPLPNQLPPAPHQARA